MELKSPKLMKLVMVDCVQDPTSYHYLAGNPTWVVWAHT